jgi:HlyD family secretion protein
MINDPFAWHPEVVIDAKTRFTMRIKLIVAVCLAAAFLLCSPQDKTIISASGSIEATQVLVGSRQGGMITELLVREGENVTAGQLIARIDMKIMELQRKQMQAALAELHLSRSGGVRAVTRAKDQLENVNRKFLRIKALLADSSASPQQFEDSEVGLQAAQAQLEEAQAAILTVDAREQQLLAQLAALDVQIADGDITAPLAGVVLEKYAERGEILPPGGPVVALADLQHLSLKIYLAESDLGRIRLDGAAELRIASFPERVFPGRISHISPKAEFTPKNVQTREARDDLVYAVKITLENPEGIFKIGMPVDVTMR